MELEPYLFFSGNCEEALNFYKGIFGGEITSISRWKDSPADHACEFQIAFAEIHGVGLAPDHAIW